MTIVINYWMLPLLVTTIAFLVAKLKTPEPKKIGYGPDLTVLFIGGFNFICALTTSLAAWIVYSIFK